MKGALVVALVLALATPATAQIVEAASPSDGTLEETYARNCPQHEDTQVCNLLRAGMQAGAAVTDSRTTRKPALPKGASPASASAAVRADLTQKPNSVTRVLDVQDELRKGDRKKNGLYDSYVFKPRAGYVSQFRLVSAEMMTASICQSEDGTRGCFWRTDSWAVSDLDVPTGGIVAPDVPLYVVVRGQGDSGSYRLTIDEQPKTENWEKGWAARREALRALAGRVLRHPAGFLLYFAKVGDGVDVRTFDETGKFHRSAPLGNFQNGQREGLISLFANGTEIKKAKTDVWMGADSFIVVFEYGLADLYHVLPNGDVRVTVHRANKPHGRMPYSLLAPEEAKASLAQYDRNVAAVRLANDQRKSEDSGLLGAVMMGAGAAIAGGNVEMVYGAAVKGAEMTTTNEGLRSGLSGQGDAMIDAGAQRMYAERAQTRREASSGFGQSKAGSAAARPAAGAAKVPAARTVRMVLIAGILPTDADQKGPNGFSRNPNCQSNIITATIRDDRGSNVPVEELFNQYRANFLAKCQRLGTVSTGPTYEIEYPHSTRFGQTGWNDRLVTLP